MAYDISINFRQTSGYVTDGANTTYSLAQNDVVYPVSRGGFTFGWDSTSAIDCRDRNSALDPRIAGINFVPGTADLTRLFRLDIPSTGNAVVHLALGDTGGGCGGIFTLYDGSTGGTQLLQIDKSSIAAGHLVDATGTDYTDANWLTSETGVSVTTTQSFVTFSMESKYSGLAAAIRHLRIVSAGGGGGAGASVSIRRHHQLA